MIYLKKKIVGVLFVIIIFLSYSSVSLAEEDTDKKSYTILLYMVGSDLEMKNGSASSDLKEMEQTLVDNEVDNVKIVGLAGGSYFWKHDKLKNGSCFQFTITNNGMEKVTPLEKVNMGEQETLSNFLQQGVKENPADNYIVLFWDHGDGPLKGFGRDALFQNDTLTLLEMQSAFKNDHLEEHQFSFIGFDACLMANLETALVIEPYADYMIASQNTESSLGWDYSWLSILQDNVEVDDITRRILLTYEQSNKNQENENYTLSYLSLQSMKDLNICFENVIVNDNFKEIAQKIAVERKYLPSFGVEEENEQIDGKALFLKLGIPKNTTDYIFQDFVKMQVNGNLKQNTSGVSMYLPVNLKEGMKEKSKYEEIDGNETYLLLITKYLHVLSEQAYTLDVSAEPTCKKNMMKMNLPNETLMNSSLIAISPLLYVKGNTYSLGYDAMLHINGNKVTKRFDGNWLFLKDEPLYIDVDENGYKKTWLEIKRDEETCQVQMLFQWNDVNEEAEILEIVEINDNQEPMKNNIVLKEGDEISPLYPRIHFLESDAHGWSLKEWEGGNEKIRGNTIYVTDSNKLQIQYRNLNESMHKPLTYHFVLKDFRQHEYYSMTCKP